MLGFATYYAFSALIRVIRNLIRVIRGFKIAAGIRGLG